MQKTDIVAENRYSKVVREVIGESEYLKFQSSPAATVLLVGTNLESVFLMRQDREDSGGQSYYKTIGGYLNPGETPEDAVRRNLLAKVGVTLDCAPRRVGFVAGYGDAIRIPITPFVSHHWHSVVSAKFPLCEFSTSMLRGLIESPDDIYDDVTRIQVLQFLAKIF